MPIQVNINSKLPEGINIDILKQAASTTFKQVDQPNSSQLQVNLAFVSKRMSQRLNKTYAGHDYVTDVLSFPYPDNSSIRRQPEIGDIAICTSLARKQARRYKVSFKTEVCLLFVHGLLHLLGYDHQTKRAQARLNQLQNDIMETLNLSHREFTWSV